jgi:hypothetical protein
MGGPTPQCNLCDCDCVPGAVAQQLVRQVHGEAEVEPVSQRSSRRSNVISSVSRKVHVHGRDYITTAPGQEERERAVCAAGQSEWPSWPSSAVPPPRRTMKVPEGARMLAHRTTRTPRQFSRPHVVRGTQAAMADDPRASSLDGLEPTSTHSQRRRALRNGARHQRPPSVSSARSRRLRDAG